MSIVDWNTENSLEEAEIESETRSQEPRNRVAKDKVTTPPSPALSVGPAAAVNSDQLGDERVPSPFILTLITF